MPGRAYEGGRYKPMYLPHWYYLGEERITCDGTSQALTLPVGTQIVEIEAEGGLLYWSLNGNPAQASSGGYIPEDQGRIVGPLANLNSVNVQGAVGAYAHVMYFRENAEEQR